MVARHDRGSHHNIVILCPAHGNPILGQGIGFGFLTGDGDLQSGGDELGGRHHCACAYLAVDHGLTGLCALQVLDAGSRCFDHGRALPRLLIEDQADLGAQQDLSPIRERLGTLEPFAIQEGAIAAAQVFQEEFALLVKHPGMPPGYFRIDDDQAGRRAPSDHQLSLSELHNLPGICSGFDR